MTRAHWIFLLVSMVILCVSALGVFNVELPLVVRVVCLLWALVTVLFLGFIVADAVGAGSHVERHRGD